MDPLVKTLTLQSWGSIPCCPRAVAYSKLQAPSSSKEGPQLT